MKHIATLGSKRGTCTIEMFVTFIDFENPAHNMNRLVCRSFGTKAELCRTNFIIEVMRKTLLN